MTMWLRGCKAELKITKVSNGFILEWETERTEPPTDKDQWDPRGVEILATRDKLVKRIEELV